MKVFLDNKNVCVCVCVCVQLEKQQSEGTGMIIVYISVDKRGIRWGKETIKKAIQVKWTTGYKTLQQMQIPLPNICTLQRSRRQVKLEPVFEMPDISGWGLWNQKQVGTRTKHSKANIQ